MIEIIAGIGGVLAAIVWGLWQRHAGRREGKRDAQVEGMEDAAKRVERGREAVRDGRGADPGDRLRSNDGRW
jgi:hypothetical protein